MISSTICSMGITCPTEINSVTNVGKIVGIIIAAIIGLACLICIIVTVYLIFCKRKSHVQVWASPCPRPQPYGQPGPMFLYTNYPQQSRALPATDSQRIVEEPPPAYEEIETIENSTKKY